jgi:hypothetical protein
MTSLAERSPIVVDWQYFGLRFSGSQIHSIQSRCHEQPAARFGEASATWLMPFVRETLSVRRGEIEQIQQQTVD